MGSPKRNLMLVGTAFLLAGCNLTRFMADNMVGPLEKFQLAIYSEPCVRHAREAAPAMLKMLDGFIYASPENPELLLAGADMNAGLAAAMIRYEDEDWARVLFARAQDYAVRAMEVDCPELLTGLRSKDEAEFDRAVAGISASQVPHAFWYALSFGGLIDLCRDQMDLVAELPRLADIMRRVAEVDPGYYFGGPDLFLCQYYLGTSEATGGNPELGRVHYEKAWEIGSNNMLLTPVFYAEGLTRQKVTKERREEFQRVLEQVLAVGEGPEDRALVTNLAKQRAAKLLEDLDWYFDPILFE